MKKIFVLFAAVAALGLSSCTDEIEEVKFKSVSDIKLNITVAEPEYGDSQTRAVKSKWASGDKINIWYKGNVQIDPDLIIKFDGTSWIKDESAEVSGNDPQASGEIFYLYEAYNDLNEYSREKDGPRILIGESPIPLMLYGGSNTVTYTFSNETLSFNIANWSFLTNVQVVVTGLTDPSKYMLKCTNLATILGVGLYESFFSGRGSYINEYTQGVANDDGVAFYFSGAVSSDPSNYTFTLCENGTEYNYNAGTKSIDNNNFTAIKIDKSKFGL